MWINYFNRHYGTDSFYGMKNDNMMSTNGGDISIVNTPTIALKIIEDVSSSDEWVLCDIWDICYDVYYLHNNITIYHDKHSFTVSINYVYYCNATFIYLPA